MKTSSNRFVSAYSPAADVALVGGVGHVIREMRRWRWWAKSDHG